MTDHRAADGFDGDDPLDLTIRDSVRALADEAPAPPDVFPPRRPGASPPASIHPIGGRRRALIASAAAVLLLVAAAAVIVTRSDDPEDTVRAGTATTATDGATATTEDLPLVGTRWELESATQDGKPIEFPDRPVILVIGDGQPCAGACRPHDATSYEYTTGCNDGGGTIRVERNEIYASRGGETLVACALQIRPFEIPAKGMMSRPPSTFQIDGHTLVLRGPEGRDLIYRAGSDGLPNRRGSIVVAGAGRLAFQLVARVDGDGTVVTFDRTYDGAHRVSAELWARVGEPFGPIGQKAHVTGGDLVYGLVPATATKVTYTPSKTDPIDVPIRRLEGSPFQAFAAIVPSGDQKWRIAATDIQGLEVAGLETDLTGQTIDPFGDPDGKEVARGATNEGQYRVSWSPSEGGGRLTLDRAAATRVLPPVSIDVQTGTGAPGITAAVGHMSVHNLIYGIVTGKATQATFERTAGDRGPFKLVLAPLPGTDRKVVSGDVPSGPDDWTIRVYDAGGTELAVYHHQG